MPVNINKKSNINIIFINNKDTSKKDISNEKLPNSKFLSANDNTNLKFIDYMLF